MQFSIDRLSAAEKVPNVNPIMGVAIVSCVSFTCAQAEVNSPSGIKNEEVIAKAKTRMTFLGIAAIFDCRVNGDVRTCVPWR